MKELGGVVFWENPFVQTQDNEGFEIEGPGFEQNQYLQAVQGLALEGNRGGSSQFSEQALLGSGLRLLGQLSQYIAQTLNGGVEVEDEFHFQFLSLHVAQLVVYQQQQLVEVVGQFRGGIYFSEDFL